MLQTIMTICFVWIKAANIISCLVLTAMPSQSPRACNSVHHVVALLVG